MVKRDSIDVSIMIVSWNGREVIKVCLDSIYSAKYPFSIETAVVDNGSKDETIRIIEQNFPQVTLVKKERNLGYARGNNIGMKKLTGRYIVLLNQDIEMTAGALESMYRFMEQPANSNVGAIAPQLRYPDGRIQKSCRKFPDPQNIIKDAASLGKWHDRQYDHGKSQFVDQPMASCLMVRTEILRKLHGFDLNPHFSAYFNDVDLSYRIQGIGYKHYFMASCFVIHHHGQSMRRWPEFKRLLAWSKGLYYFLAKHYAKERVWMKYLLKGEVFFIFTARVILGIAQTLISGGFLISKKGKINP